jgi:mannose-6-phosphate isomerase-like protein (cupin superfamily)
MPDARPFVVRHDDADIPIEHWDDPVKGKVSWRTLVSGDRTPSAELTVGVADIEPGRPDAHDPHRHAQAEVYSIVSGEGIVNVGGIDHAVAIGATVFIPGGVWHFARNTGNTTLRLIYVFAADSFSDIEYEFP